MTRDIKKRYYEVEHVICEDHPEKCEGCKKECITWTLDGIELSKDEMEIFNTI